MEPPTKRGTYEASFKLKVIKAAKASNNCAAVRTLDVTEKILLLLYKTTLNFQDDFWGLIGPLIYADIGYIL